MKKYLSILILIFTTSCVETLVVGAAAGGVLATQNNTVKETKDDVIITAKIDKEFVKAGLKDPTEKVGVTVDRKRVLLTGIVSDVRIAKKANEVAWSVAGVKEVIDEIQIKEDKSSFGNFFSYFKDASITAQISTKALFNKDVSSVDFDVITINRIVYLIGSAKDQEEIKAIHEIASGTIGVKKVISHIVINN